jgi:o-succinylbenzoate---CoA ligase
VAVDGYAPPTLSELRTHVKTTLNPTAAPREVHIVDELPRRGIGKVDRRRLVALFSD